MRAHSPTEGLQTGLNQAPLHALVVDDEETIREFLTMGLRYEGWTVDAVPDGPSALVA